jgi:hypothetical protein
MFLVTHGAAARIRLSATADSNRTDWRRFLAITLNRH